MIPLNKPEDRANVPNDFHPRALVSKLDTTIFNNPAERDNYLSTLPNSELLRLKSFYEDIKDKTRLPYANVVMEGITEELARRSVMPIVVASLDSMNVDDKTMKEFNNLVEAIAGEIAQTPLFNEVHHYRNSNEPFDVVVSQSLDVDCPTVDGGWFLEAWEAAQLLGNA